jgi:site-specific DNA recombinase
MARTEEPRSGPLRCAIYTRKSTEEGLEQNFNSLDAQREACEAYVASQRHEGWTLSPELYDDGGFSGGNMERPGLKQLLADVKAGNVHVIVVYKVDRLTRSLADFAKIVEVLDDAKASFVSVTQSFNTTTSMGRLTLNVLLSFAQFEREVTGERIRDKLAQSKARGMWMGGNVPLGYVVEDRKLKIVEEEAQKVRQIFHRYLELGSVPALVDELEAKEIRSQARVSRSGRAMGGAALTKRSLYHILKSRTYVGDVVHKGQAYPGEHQAIIDPQIFEEVQQLLKRNAVARKNGDHAESPSLLPGLVCDGLGRRMTPDHARKGQLRYRYYASRQDTPAERAVPAWRVPAVDLEEIVIGALTTRLRDHDALRRMVDPTGSNLNHLRLPFDRAALLASELAASDARERRRMLATLVEKVIVHQDRVEFCVRIEDALMLNKEIDPQQPTTPITLIIATRIARTGKRTTIAIAPTQAVANQRHDPSLIKLIAKAFAARSAVEAEAHDPKDLARELGQDKDYFARLVRLGYLAPDIISAILDGRQPAVLTRQRLARVSKLPIDWSEQRQLLGFARA